MIRANKRSFFRLISGVLVALPGLLLGQELQWARQIGGPGFIDLKNTVTDSPGNVYIIGSFQGTVDFDPSSATQTRSSGPNLDLFVAKYTADGGLVFVNQISVATDDGDITYAEDIASDASGNIFISASFRGDITLGATTLSSTPDGGRDSRDILLARYNADGSLAFAYQLGSTGTEYGYALATTSDNKILLVGRFQGEFDFDPTAGETILQSGDNTDIFIARYNPDGSLDAATAFGGDDYQTANCLAVDVAGNIIIAGSYRNRITLDPSSGNGDLSNPGTRNGFVAKYDQNFNFQFAAPLLLPQNSEGEELEITTFIQLDLANNILVTGRFSGQVVVSGQSLTAVGGDDIYLAKYQPDGGLVFARRYGDTSFEEARDVTTDQAGNLYIVGNFQGTLDLDETTTDDNLSNAGENDGFLAKLSPSGDYINVQPIRSNGEVLLKRLTRHPNNPQTLIMGGMFEENLVLTEAVSFTSQGDFDVFLARYDLSRSPPSGNPVSLATLSAYEGLPGTPVTLFGENFSTTLEENNVRFGEAKATLVNVNEAGTELTVTVPEALDPGSYEVSVAVGATSDAADQPFTVPEKTALTLTSLSASDGRSGDLIILAGSGFTTGALVNFGAEAVAIDAVNNEGTAITVTVPEYPPGDYEVSVTVGESTTTSLAFQINEPSALNLQSLSIYVGRVGDELVLRGENFGPAIEDNAVAFAETAAEVISVNEMRTELTVRVPDVAVGNYAVLLRANEQADTADRAFLVDDYCASSAQEDAGIRIDQVRLNETNYIAEGGCAAYTNFTDQPARLVVGRTAPLRVTVSTCSEDASKAVRIFADWNGDLDFDDEGETVATSAPLTGSTTFETAINVPPAVPANLVTRLRVVLSSVNETLLPTGISACGVYTTGETQDYSVQLVASPPPRITALSPTVLEANIPGSLIISGENFGDAIDSVIVELRDGDRLITATDVQVNGTGTQITVTTPPLAVGNYGVQVSVGNQTVIAEEAVSVTDEPVVEADQLPPTIVLNAPSLLNKEDATFAVNSEVRDASGVGSVTLEFLPIRKNPRSDDWRKISGSQEGTTDTYIAQLTDTDLDELGVQTRIIATDAVGNSDTSAIQYTFRNYTTTQPLAVEELSPTRDTPSANDYNLFCIPLQNQSVRQAFGELGEYNTRRWRAWQLGSNGQADAPYQEFSRGWTGELQAGQGYLLIYTEETAFQTTGPVVEATYDTPFTLVLPPGFTLIGNPYPFALDWNQVLTFNGLDTEDLRLKTFRGGFQPASRLEAFQGGLVVNPTEGQPLTLALPVGTVTTPGGRNGRVKEKHEWAADEAWQLSFTLREGELTRRASIGMHPDAQPGYDRYDDFTPPRLANFPELNSEHPEFFLPKFSQDVVPTAAQHRWNWEIAASEPNQTVTLHWDPEEVSYLPQTLTLVDDQRVRTLDMREQSSYSFQVDAAGTHRLQVVYGESEALANQLLAGEAYPNPAADQLYLPVRLPQDERLTLEVFDATGRRVDKQVYDELAAGYHTLIWQRNTADRPTPAGLYLYRIHVAGTDRTVSGRVLLE